MSTDPIRNYLGVTLSREQPFLLYSEETVVASSSSPDSIDPKKLFVSLCNMLRSGRDSGESPDSPTEMMAMKIYEFAMQRINQSSTSVRHDRWELAAALDVHRGDNLSRTFTPVPALAPTPTPAPSPSVEEEAAHEPDEEMIKLQDMVAGIDLSAGIDSVIASPRKKSEVVAHKVLDLHNSLRRSSSRQERTAPNLEGLFLPPQEEKVIPMGPLEAKLIRLEREAKSFLKDRTRPELDSLLVFWRDPADKKYEPPPSQMLFLSPLRGAVCQASVLCDVNVLPDKPHKGAQDILRTIEYITIGGERVIKAPFSQDDKINFTRITEGFRKVVELFLQKLSDSEEKRQEIVQEWEKILRDPKHENITNETPRECIEAFIAYLLKDGSTDLHKDLCHLLRAAIQDTYVIPMQEVKELLRQYPLTVTSPSIEFSFSKHLGVKVVSKQSFTIEVEGKKNTSGFTVVMKNTLSCSLWTLSQWDSEIVLEVSQAFPQEIKAASIEGGFFVINV